MAARALLVDVVKQEILEGPNYDVWSRKVKLLMRVEKIIGHLTAKQIPPTDDSNLHEVKAYQKWKAKDEYAMAVLLGSMKSDLMKQFEIFETTYDVWQAVNDIYGRVDPSRLRAMSMDLSTYSMPPGTSMRDHLRKMTQMFRDLREAGSNLTEDEAIDAVVRTLPTSWEPMKVFATHDNSIKSLADLSHCLILEDERKSSDASFSVLASQSSKPGSFKKRKGFKPRRYPQRKRQAFGPQQKSSPNQKSQAQGPSQQQQQSPQQQQQKRGTLLRSKTCWNCGLKGHIARFCRKPKKLRSEKSDVQTQEPQSM